MAQQEQAPRKAVRRPPKPREREHRSNHQPGRRDNDLLASLRMAARDVKYHIPEEVAFRAQTLKREHRDELRLHLIGRSRQGLPLFGLQIGRGERVVLAVANVYAQEAVGTTTLLLLAYNLLKNASFQSLRERLTFLLLPQMNPDGMNLNLGWMKTDFSLSQYVQHQFQDLPEDEIDFGFPLDPQESVRPEVEAITNLLQEWPRVDLLLHLRGSVISGGVGFGLHPPREETWKPILPALEEACTHLHLPLQDVDHFGRQGIKRIRRGYQSLPTAQAMRDFFRAGDPDYAEAFRLSMWEYLQHHCGTPLALTVSVPMAQVEGLSDLKPSERSRAALEEERARTYQETAESLEQILNGLKLPAGVASEAHLRLHYHRRLADLYRILSNALLADRSRFEGVQATRRDLLEARIEAELLGFMPLTASLQVLRATNHPGCRGQQIEYQESLRRRFHAFQHRHHWSYVTLRDQIRMQMAALLTVASMPEEVPAR